MLGQPQLQAVGPAACLLIAAFEVNVLNCHIQGPNITTLGPFAAAELHLHMQSLRPASRLAPSLAAPSYGMAGGELLGRSCAA